MKTSLVMVNAFAVQVCLYSQTWWLGTRCWDKNDEKMTLTLTRGVGLSSPSPFHLHLFIRSSNILWLCPRRMKTSLWLMSLEVAICDIPNPSFVLSLNLFSVFKFNFSRAKQSLPYPKFPQNSCPSVCPSVRLSRKSNPLPLAKKFGGNHFTISHYQ